MDNKRIIDENFKKRLLFALAVIAGGAVIVYILLHLQTILGTTMGVLGWISHVLTGFTAGFVIAYLLFPVVGWLQKNLMKLPYFRNREKGARGIGIAATYLLIFLVIFGVLTAILVAVTKQVQTINFADLPAIIQDIKRQVLGLAGAILEALDKIGVPTEGLEEWVNDKGEHITGSLSSVGNGLFSFANNVKGFFGNALFAVIFSIYFLLDTEGLLAYWSHAFEALLGRRAHGFLAGLLADADTCFSGYIRGQLADAAFMTVAVSILLSLVSVPYSIVIGICSGIGNLIPYVGPFVAYGLTAGVCVATGRWTTLVIALVLLFVLQTVDGNIVNPRLLSQSIDVHPVLIIVGLLFGSAAGGFFGMLLAVPVASFLKIQFEKVVAWRSGGSGTARN
ncbi:MAG: AI-2E family transporter [Lachnospiraceae bacterium]|nr:AI-2E family transporter [Lachnospiraceae bacterium]